MVQIMNKWYTFGIDHQSFDLSYDYCVVAYTFCVPCALYLPKLFIMHLQVWTLIIYERVVHAFWIVPRIQAYMYRI